MHHRRFYFSHSPSTIQRNLSKHEPAVRLPLQFRSLIIIDGSPKCVEIQIAKLLIEFRTHFVDKTPTMTSTEKRQLIQNAALPVNVTLFLVYTWTCKWDTLDVSQWHHPGTEISFINGNGHRWCVYMKFIVSFWIIDPYPLVKQDTVVVVRQDSSNKDKGWRDVVTMNH